MEQDKSEKEHVPYPFLESRADERNSAFSPDGRYLAYDSNESGKYEVYVVPFPKKGGKWQISSGGGFRPMWSRNGKELTYTQGSRLMTVSVSLPPTFDFSAPKKLCDLPPSSRVFDIMPDGQRFAIAMAQSDQVAVTKINVVVGWFDELREKFAGKK